MYFEDSIPVKESASLIAELSESTKYKIKLLFNYCAIFVDQLNLAYPVFDLTSKTKIPI